MQPRGRTPIQELGLHNALEQVWDLSAQNQSRGSAPSAPCNSGPLQWALLGTLTAPTASTQQAVPCNALHRSAYPQPTGEHESQHSREHPSTAGVRAREQASRPGEDTVGCTPHGCTEGGPWGLPDAQASTGSAPHTPLASPPPPASSQVPVTGFTVAGAGDPNQEGLPRVVRVVYTLGDSAYGDE